jgi:hypothetical protein
MDSLLLIIPILTASLGAIITSIGALLNFLYKRQKDFKKQDTINIRVTSNGSEISIEASSLDSINLREILDALEMSKKHNDKENTGTTIRMHIPKEAKRPKRSVNPIKNTNPKNTEGDNQKFTESTSANQDEQDTENS